MLWSNLVASKVSIAVHTVPKDSFKISCLYVIDLFVIIRYNFRDTLLADEYMPSFRIVFETFSFTSEKCRRFKIDPGLN